MNLIISRRLLILSLLSMGLIFAVIFSLFRLHSHQTEVNKELQHIMQLQLNLDILRSHLWQFHEYEDQSGFEQAQRTQQALAEKLVLTHIQSDLQPLELLNLQRMNATIGALLEMNVASSRLGRSLEQPHAKSMLQARFNMTIQGMTEDLYRLHQQAINEAQRVTLQLLYLNGITLLIIAIVLAVFAYATLRRFKVGFTMLHHGMNDLAKGDLSSRLCPSQKDEFTQLAEYFNQMKGSLEKTTIKRDLLQYEVEQQTSQLRSQHMRLRFLAEHDDLTGLYNRRAFENQVKIALARDRRTDSMAGMLFIDLDKFKEINDTHGHDVGDFILTVTAERLKGLIRESDLLGRLGGDEFVVWLDLISKKEEVGNKAQGIMEALTQPIEYLGQPLAVGCSIGISIFPYDGKQFTELLKAADQAMYSAKPQQQSAYCFYQGQNLSET
ncbi:diguanylate cyclase [Motilimonas sp. E26]|uniref:diguanylate cyclase domain-containing protein n=1 Tax=Motilimonas sp. E26 TaxID=2865674 RepID=UPI001E58EABC|nr:diguanylate cyclase [Motilimonas sp. E26]